MFTFFCRYRVYKSEHFTSYIHVSGSHFFDTGISLDMHKSVEAASMRGKRNLMTKKSHCPQVDGSGWDGIMKRVVEIYTEETISYEQVCQMSKRICTMVNASIESNELRERHSTSTSN